MPRWRFNRGPSTNDNLKANRPVPRGWVIAAAVAIGLAIGLGGFTFVYARGASYLTNDPEACGNCHIMREHLSAWLKSSHHAVATCNDCHTPHNIIGKYVTKASNGFWHSFYFTTGRFPDPLRITEGNRGVTEGTCRYCHGDIVEAIDPASRHAAAPHQPAVTATGRNQTVHHMGDLRVRAVLATIVPQAPVPSPKASSGSTSSSAEELSCIRCHRYVGHLVR
jgi:cytochrome c nitrite reductase small subunit